MTGISTIRCTGAVALAVIPLLAVLAGCSLISGTFRIDHELTGTYSSQDSVAITPLAIDLSGHADFKKYRDRIQTVDAVGLVFEATNNDSTDADSCSVWMSPNLITAREAEGIRGSAIAREVLHGLALPAGKTTDLSYDLSLSLEANRDWLAKTARGGSFYFYVLGTRPGFDLTIAKFSTVVIFTAQL